MTDDPYIYPGTKLLRNKLGIRDADELNRAERLLVRQRASEKIQLGNFDLPHLQAIHRHLFQDVYDWAGELRTVEINKGGDQFMFRQYIVNGMADVHRRIVVADYFRGTTATAFAAEAGRIIGDVNHVHPFREGNGRTQLLYLQQLSGIAGHSLVLRHIDAKAWLAASKRANNADYALMGQVIRAALERTASTASVGKEKTSGEEIIIHDLEEAKTGTDQSGVNKTKYQERY
jgi:cell filamentation protein